MRALIFRGRCNMCTNIWNFWSFVEISDDCFGAFILFYGSYAIFNFTQWPQNRCTVTIVTVHSRCTVTIVWLPLTRECLFGFNASGHCLVHVRMMHHLRVGLCITIMQLHTHTMRQTHTHKAVTRCVEAKKFLFSSKVIGVYYLNNFDDRL